MVLAEKSFLKSILHNYFNKVLGFNLEVVKNGSIINVLTNADKILEELDTETINNLETYIREVHIRIIEDYLTKYEENAGKDWSSYVYWTEVLEHFKKGA